MKPMHIVMEYCIATEKRGLKLEPDKKFNGDPYFELVILGTSDSDFAKDPDSRKSVSGNSAFLCGAPVAQLISMQKIGSLSVTEAYCLASTINAQYNMMYVNCVLKFLRLKVELPMILEMYNKGAVYLVNNFSCGGRTRHIET
jgi:hypothetical protein